MKNILFYLIISFSTLVFSQKIKYSLNTSNSYIQYKASHLLHDWSGINNNLKGVIVYNSKSNNFDKLAVLAKISDFDSKNINRDSRSHEILEILSFPQIKFFSDKINIDQKKITLKGLIDFHGIVVDQNVNADIVRKENIFILSGNIKISLLDFNISLPSFMFSKIEDVVEVYFEIEFIKEN